MGSLWGISSNTRWAESGVENFEYMEIIELDTTESDWDPDLRATPWSWRPKGLQDRAEAHALMIEGRIELLAMSSEGWICSL